MPALTFGDFLRAQDVDAERSRIVRHDRRGLAELTRGRQWFDQYVATQVPGSQSPYNNATLAFQFVPGPTLDDGRHSALFVCAHSIGDNWIVGDPPLLPPAHDPVHGFRPGPADRAYVLTALGTLEPWTRRILIDWGAGAIAWSQWTINQPKEIVELRRRAAEPPFPGFTSLVTRRSELLLLPQPWQATLRSVRGVYLLVCPETGRQYVGSAGGVEGIWGRWFDYATNGHGSNTLLQRDGVRDWVMSVLELCSPLMTQAEVVAREAHWKERLGSRAFGLNAN